MALETNQNQFFESVLFESVGFDVPIRGIQFLSGGSINVSVKIGTDEGTFFVKWNEAGQEGMFESEAKGLDLLRQTGVFQVPAVVAYGQKFERSYLMLEYISSAVQKANFWEDFGRSLAALHRHSQSQFGLSFNNYIGSLPQNNEWCSNGVAFFIERRLKAQAGLAFYHGRLTKERYGQFEQLYARLPELLPQESPALLHGDLWSGNFMVGSRGLASLIDPAVYYGLREAEIAFTTLFGGFQPAFYEAYAETYPLEKGFQERIALYNLYPLLVHVNLFGSGYLSGVERTLDRFCR